MLGAMEKLTVGESPSELSLADVVASAEEQNRDIKQNFTLLCTEPFILGSTVHAQLNTRAELLADENGKVHTIYGRDKYISGVLLEVVHDAVQQTAISDYTYRLLKLLQDNPDDKAYRAVILQQISNVCHFEYGRVKAAFQRTLHRGVKTRNGKDLFKRQSGALDKFGNPRVKMAFNPGDLAKTDPGLYCLTRFCLPETGYAEGAYWLSKMVEVEVKQPSLGDWLAKMHTAAFCDLVLLLGFIHDLNLGLTLPSTSRQKGQTFVARSQDLATELLALRSEVDIRDFTAPVSALLKPGSSKGALRALDQFIIDKVGTKMGFLYDDLVEECLGSIDGEYEREKVRLARQEKKKEIENAEWIPFPVSAEMTTEKRIEQRREKEKTRPAHASPYDISPAAPPAEESVAESATSVFKVSAATAKVFSTLFDNTQSRGAINWVDFESAMVELRFSIKPTSGSAYTFIPALGTGLKKFNAHRPHQGRIEGWRILHLAKRLTNMYGWGEKTFEIA
ncbi:uncharacterized protein B0H64DRAFT_379343 [Chaetomium fimeti]|uniref:Uncharacterized protein n=1 Tax=Chaetomium fimeti TaxID=1854472 RepID=A0AAE0HNQ5_9PEZI|nr:hypothetical protein B0H64DRAFT_379343 [Chaetomium fimeti]